MFFLLRMAFWLTLVLVLLPTDKSGDADKSKARALDPMEAATAAAAAMSDMSQFCARQPTACEIGGKAAVAIGERAQSGARKVYQFISEKTEKKTGDDKQAGDERKAAEEKKVEEKKVGDSRKTAPDKTKKHPDHTGSIGGAPDADGAWRGTLNDGDLQIEWRPLQADAGQAG